MAITFDETNGTAKKADLTSDWYSYENQKWANAVILRTKEDYQVGETISEENIESYFVWIPRYEYQLWNGVTETDKFINTSDLGIVDDATIQTELNKQQLINIKFVNKNDVIKFGNTKGSWLTHPAFTSFDSNGFWVGKFETGYNQDSAGEEKITTDDWKVEGAIKDEINSDKIIIKPNVYSWRNIRIANAFYTAYDYRRNLDSHVMKNMEWGAIAYLANSKYGLCSAMNCTTIMFNNNSNYITGYASSTQPTCSYTASNENCNKYEGTELNTNGNNTYRYNDKKSNTASTTQNYYGVYDMAGGAGEYVMGVMLDEQNKPASGSDKNDNSNFVGTLTKAVNTWTKEDGGMEWPNKKYYDVYTYDTLYQQYQRGLFGDATKEIGPFYTIQFYKESQDRYVDIISSSYYADYARFVYSIQPWFTRGGHWNYGSGTGIMSYSSSSGKADDGQSFRIVLTP